MGFSSCGIRSCSQNLCCAHGSPEKEGQVCNLGQASPWCLHIAGQCAVAGSLSFLGQLLPRGLGECSDS